MCTPGEDAKLYTYKASGKKKEFLRQECKQTV